MRSTSSVGRNLGSVDSDRLGTAESLRGIGRVRWREGEYDAALKAFQESLTLSEELDNKALSAAVLSERGLGFDQERTHQA